MNARAASEGLASLEPRALVMLLGGGLLIAGLGAWFYAFEGDLVRYQRLREARAAAAREVAGQESTASPQRIEALEHALRTLHDQLYGSASDRGPSQMVSYIIGRLDAISRRHDIGLVSVEPGASSDVLSYLEVPFDVEVTGAFRDLYSWLREAEVELRPMVVKQFQLLSAGRDGLLRMTLRVVSYRPQAGRR